MISGPPVEAPPAGHFLPMILPGCPRLSSSLSTPQKMEQDGGRGDHLPTVYRCPQGTLYKLCPCTESLPLRYQLYGTSSLLHTWVFCSHVEGKGGGYYVNLVSHEAQWVLPEVPRWLRPSGFPPYMFWIVKCYRPTLQDAEIESLLCEYDNRYQELMKILESSSPQTLRMDVIVRLAAHKPSDLAFAEEFCSPRARGEVCMRYSPPRLEPSTPWPENLCALREALQVLLPHRSKNVDEVLRHFAGQEVKAVRELWGHDEREVGPPLSLPRDVADPWDYCPSSLSAQVLVQKAVVANTCAVAFRRALQNSDIICSQELALVYARKTLAEVSQLITENSLHRYRKESMTREVTCLTAALNTTLAENESLQKQLAMARARVRCLQKHLTSVLQDSSERDRSFQDFLKAKENDNWVLRQFVLGSRYNYDFVTGKGSHPGVTPNLQKSRRSRSAT